MSEFEENIQDINETAKTEFIDADRAIENTETALKDLADINNAVTKKAYDEALTKQRNAMENLSRKILEGISKEPMSDSDFNTFKNVLEKLTGMKTFDFERPTDTDGQNVLDASKYTVDPKIDSAVKKTMNGSTDAVSNDVNKELTSDQKNRANDLDNRNANAAKKILDAEKANDKQKASDALEELGKTKKEMNDLLEENEKLKEKIKAKSGDKGWNAYKLFKWLFGLVALLSPYLLLKLYADAETGCYKYDAKSQTKLSCPTDKDHPEWCSCGNKEHLFYQPDKAKECNENEALHNYPFCCGGINPNLPLCSDPINGAQPGDDGYIYYAFVRVEPGDVFKKAVDSALVAFEKAISSIWNIIKWIIIVIVIIFVIFIVIKFTLMIIDSRKNKKSLKSQKSK